MDFQAVWVKVKKELIYIILLIFTCSLVLTLDYYGKIEKPNLYPRMELHQQILSGEAPSPYQYRVLVPGLAEFLRLIFLRSGDEKAFLLAYLVYDFTAISFSLFSLYLVIRLWFKPEQALVGLLFTAVVMPVNFKDHYFQPWSFLEIGMFALGLFALYRQKWLAFGAIIFVSSFNRETTVFLPVLYWIPLIVDLLKTWHIEKDDLRNYLRGLIFFLVWVIVFVGLRVILGNAPYVNNVLDVLRQSLQLPYLVKTAVAYALFLGFFWILVVRGYFNAPRFLKAGMWMVPFYIITCNIWGYWFETRVLMTLYSIFIPTGLCALFKPASPDPVHQGNPKG